MRATIRVPPTRASSHGADANRSDRRRAGYTIRYFSPALRFDPVHPRNRGHKLWPARGRDLAGNPVE
jgi:hypothetical protein